MGKKLATQDEQAQTMKRWVMLLGPLLGCTGALAEVRPVDLSLVHIRSVAPQVVVDLRYATAQNFTGKVLYPSVADCYLRADVARALGEVDKALRTQGLGIKVFDCYRPLRVQFLLWEIVHDERYVADPKKGSRHNRGAAVDLTLIDAAGQELAMPTAFDDFSEKAHRSYEALPQDVKRNRSVLEQAMTKAGFVGLATEWWHFDFQGWQRYPHSDTPFEALAAVRPGP
ncbi:MAG: D-alanyl-D-alanine dipeptidase [Myxococcales bacterium]|nr:D-alanyl-D-alanine dipeptidase [Myxococcales bacterium]